jgi:hypothetical protein
VKFGYFTGPEQTSQKPTISFEDQTQIWDSKTGEILKEAGKKRPRTAKQLEHIDQVKSWGGACHSCKAKHRRVLLLIFTCISTEAFINPSIV